MARTKQTPEWEATPFRTLEVAKALTLKLGLHPLPVRDIELPAEFLGFQVTQHGQTTIIAQRRGEDGKGTGSVRQLELPRPKRHRKQRESLEPLPPLEERIVGYFRYVVDHWKQVAGIPTLEEALEAHGYTEPIIEGRYAAFEGASMMFIEYVETDDGQVFTRMISKPVREKPNK